MARSAQGDRRAFDQIVVRHGPFALRVALRLVVDRHLAEDLAQEAMVRAWRRAADFDPSRARFSTWLYRIVVNLCLDQRRRISAESLPDEFDPIDPAPHADQALEIDQRRSTLARAVLELPLRQRAAITLVYGEDLSVSEAARVLGTSSKAVERLLARGRAGLRAQLPPSGGEETSTC
jgi:RNA polymerase sigma-70 factor (ECF subfamily)